MSRKEEKPRVDVYTRITDRIVADLEKGVRPWMQPWRSRNAIGRVTLPLRHNGLPYSGTVSYTHLDVYKRQGVLGRSCTAPSAPRAGGGLREEDGEGPE